MSRDQLSPYEKGVVQRISLLAKCDLNNENDVINLTADLVSAVKNLSAQASQMITIANNHSNHQDTAFFQHRDKLHEDIRAFVTSVKNGNNSQGRYELNRNAFLGQLKGLAQSTKSVIDGVNAVYPVIPTEPKTLTEDDLAEEHDDVPTCTGCQLVIEKNASTLKFASSLWHPSCFVCKKCSKPIESAQFLILEGKPVCHPCSPKCAKCGLPVITDCVAALRKYFHASCFSCDGCKTLIENTSQFYQKNGRPCCAVCISRNSVFDHVRNARSGIYFEEESSEGDLIDPTKKRGSQQSEASSAIRESYTSDDSASQISSTVNSTNGGEQHPSRPGSQSPANPRCLLGVLGREEGVTLLIQFCMEDYSIEKIFFFLDVTQFKVVTVTEAELAGYAKSIHRKYILQDAEMTLELPENVKEEIDAKLHNNQIGRDLFNAAERLVYEDLEKDIFPRFFYSLAGKKYLTKVIEEEKMQQLSFNSGVMRITAGSINKKPAEKPTEIKIRSSLNVIDESTVVEITNFEKRYEKQKYYVYEITVTKAGVDSTTENMFVFRRYSEFFQLHEALTRRYPEAPFPPFPPKIFIRRSSVKSVALSRMQDLDYYLKGILSMKDISHSEALAQFLKPTEDDLQNFWFNKRLSQFSNQFSSKYH